MGKRAVSSKSSSLLLVKIIGKETDFSELRLREKNKKPRIIYEV